MKYTIQVCDFIFQVIYSSEKVMEIQSIEFIKEKSVILSAHLPEKVIQLKNTIENTLLGGNTDFIEENVSFGSFTPKEIQVLKALRTIPRGSVISYSELGKKAGLSEHAGRFVDHHQRLITVDQLQRRWALRAIEISARRHVTHRGATQRSRALMAANSGAACSSLAQLISAIGSSWK